MTAEKWQKEYAYGIRYNYGLEGKRVNWSPHSCMKIISEPGTNANAGEHHGCPFKSFDESQLRAQLQQMNVGGSEMNFILEKVRTRPSQPARLSSCFLTRLCYARCRASSQVRGQHYQVACGKYFEAKHKGSALIETELGGITHPNQFFDESMKFHGSADGDATKANGSAAAGTSGVTAAPESPDVPMAAPEAVPVA